MQKITATKSQKMGSAPRLSFIEHHLTITSMLHLDYLFTFARGIKKLYRL